MPDFKKLPTVNATAVALVDHVHPAGGPAGGLGLWLEAGQIAGVADGATVTTWPDASGNGFDATQATSGMRPTYRAAATGGRPTVRFDGTDDVLVTGDVLGSTLFGAAATTIFLVQRQDGGQVVNTPMRWNHLGTTNRVNLFLSFADTLYFDYGDESAGGRISGAQPAGWDDAFHVVTLYRSGTAGQVWADGTSVFSGTFSDNLDPSPSAPLSVGAIFDGTAAFKGDIAELLIYPRALSLVERETLEASLISKYAIGGPSVSAFASTVKWGTD